MNTSMKKINETVLVVDDAVIVRTACERALKKAGFEVITADEGADAMIKLRENPVPAILLDLKMPIMTGLDLMRLVAEAWPRTEVVIMTAFAESPMAPETRKLGAGEILTKPFDNISDVVGAVTRAVMRSQLRRGMTIEGEAVLRSVLVERGDVLESELRAAISEAERKDMPAVKALQEMGVIGEEKYRRAVAEFLGVQYLELDPRDARPDLLGGLTPSWCRRNICLPAGREGDVTVFAAADPFSDAVRDRIEERADGPFRIAQAPEADIMAAIDRLEAEVFPGSMPPEDVARVVGSRKSGDKGKIISSLLRRSEVVNVDESYLRHHGEGRFSFSFRGNLEVGEDGNR